MGARRAAIKGQARNLRIVVMIGARGRGRLGVRQWYFACLEQSVCITCSQHVCFIKHTCSVRCSICVLGPCSAIHCRAGKFALSHVIDCMAIGFASSNKHA